MLVAALLGGLAAAAPAPAAAAAEPESACVGESADESAALLLAADCAAPVEVTGLRSESTETFANPDGTFTFRSYVAPVRVRRGSDLVPLDTTLRMSGGVVAPQATVADLRFSAGGTGPLATIGAEGKELSLSWPGPLPAPGLSGSVATYPEVLPGIDLKVRADGDGFSKVLVVRDRAAAANPALAAITFGTSTREVTLQEGPGESLLAVDSTGVPVFVSSGAFMWDSSGPEASNGCDQPPAEELQTRIPVRVADGGLTVTPDAAVLASADTVFPVCIDPSFNYLTDKWTHVWKANPDTSYWGSYRDSMRVGRVWGGGSNDVWRTFVRINIGGLVNNGLHILDAHFFTKLDHSASCTPTSVDLWHTGFVSPSSPPTTWNNSAGSWLTHLGTVAANANEAGGCGYVQPDVWMEWGGAYLRNAVQGMVNGTFGIMTFGLKAVIETDDSKWKRFYPADSSDANLRTYLSVTFDKPPNAPTVQPLSTTTDCYQACSSPAVVRTTQPTFKVGVSDPYNGNLRTVFEVRAAASDTATLVTGNAAAPVVTAAPGTAQWQVPSGKLSNGTTYYWRARSTDENNLTGPWTGWQTLKVDISPPGVSSVTSTQYPFKQWGAVVGTAGTFTLTGPSDVNEFTWWVDAGASTTVTASGTTSKAATVSHTPAKDMVHTLSVKAKDIAGNTGPTYGHQFWVSPLANRCWNWRLDETSGTTAADKGNTDPADPVCAPIGSSVTPMPGTLSGSVAFAAGYIGNGGSFTGLGGQITTTGPVLDTKKSFTVMAWVRASDLAAGGLQTVLSQDGSNASRFVLRFDQGANGGAGGWCFGLRASDSTAAAPVSACADGGTWGVPAQGSWMHLAGVYDATTSRIRVYVMGDPLSCGGEMSEVAVTGSWAASGSLAIGRAKGSSSDNWRGLIDQVYAHQRVLSASEICQQALQ